MPGTLIRGQQGDSSLVVSGPRFLQLLSDVVQDVVDVLQADGESDEIRSYARGQLLLGRELLGISDHQDFSYQPLYDDKVSADSLRYCMNYFDIKDDLLVVSGDNLIDIDLQNFVNFHQQHKPMLTVALKELGPEENISQYGVAIVDGDMRIRGFVEKPKKGSEPSRMINTAFYLFSPEILQVLQGMGDRARGIGGDLIPYLTENGYPVYGYPIKGYWIDIGTPERLHQAAMDCLSGRVRHFDRKYH